MKVDKITGIVPFTDRAIDIRLKGANLIITGKNGCGKTKLLESISQVLSKAVQYIKSKPEYEKRVRRNRENISSLKKSLSRLEKEVNRIKSQDNHTGSNQRSRLSVTSELKSLNDEIVRIEREIENSVQRINKEIRAFESLRKDEETHANVVKKNTIVEYIIDNHRMDINLSFPANRFSNFQQVDNITSMESEKSQIEKSIQTKKEPNVGSLIEKFLATWEIKAALSFKKGDKAPEVELNNWKKSFVESLRILLDDETTEINFDEETLNYEINQHGKMPFSFRDLSSGYSAILKVFCELLMQTEVSKYSPKSIQGFVIIDEIDAHLHASLQKRVLPFFTELFPNIQFIVSTHSPFVISSDDNTVVYDLSSSKTVSTSDLDLRFFSNELITESFLDVSSKSEWLDRLLTKLSNETDINTLKTIVKQLDTAEGMLDSEALTYYYNAKRKIQKHGG